MSNREMSKALTSQTLTSELTEGGSFAASKTHRERETTVNKSDRAMIEYSMYELLASLTWLNVSGGAPPRFEFYQEATAQTDMAEGLIKARSLMPLSRREVYACSAHCGNSLSCLIGSSHLTGYSADLIKRFQFR